MPRAKQDPVTAAFTLYVGMTQEQQLQFQGMCLGYKMAGRAEEKRPVGRPTGSRNKPKEEAPLLQEGAQA